MVGRRLNNEVAFVLDNIKKQQNTAYNCYFLYIKNVIRYTVIKNTAFLF